MTLSKSPERNTFQLENAKKLAEEKGETLSLDMLTFYEDIKKRSEEQEADIEWTKHNLEYDLRSTQWILDKVRNSDTYAQNLYAALCNNEFRKNEVWEILKDNKSWSCSWRHAGGIIADMRQEGDYIDWYCSGIKIEDTDEKTISKYVGEGFVTLEIQQDLLKLGWIVLDQ